MVATAGSAILFHSGLWHRQGANTSTEHRMAANLAYCPTWWARPVANWPLIEREVFDGLSTRMQELSTSSVEQTGRGFNDGSQAGVHSHTRLREERLGAAGAPRL